MGLPLELAAQSEQLACMTFKCTDKLTHFLALQGAARMVLQGDTHPAQLKDSVTNKCG
jgi:pyrroline-5-carboxylate reductase